MMVVTAMCKENFHLGCQKLAGIKMHSGVCLCACVCVKVPFVLHFINWWFYS